MTITMNIFCGTSPCRPPRLRRPRWGAGPASPPSSCAPSPGPPAPPRCPTPAPPAPPSSASDTPPWTVAPSHPPRSPDNTHDVTQWHISHCADLVPGPGLHLLSEPPPVLLLLAELTELRRLLQLGRLLLHPLPVPPLLVIIPNKLISAIISSHYSILTLW